MNTNFYAIEITSAAHDEQFANGLHQARLADAAHSGRLSLLDMILHLIARTI